MYLTETCSRVRVGKHLSDVSHQELFETRRYFIAIAFKLYFRICHHEGSGKPEWLEIKGYTSESSFFLMMLI